MLWLLLAVSLLQKQWLLVPGQQLREGCGLGGWSYLEWI
jgi:hypothetical protein